MINGHSNPASQAFTANDAELLIQVAAAAPLQNMQSAERLAQLFMRFRVFAQQAFAAQAPGNVKEPVGDAPTAND